MLEFFKRLFGLEPKAVEVQAPYKVETPATPVEVGSPSQTDKKSATGAAMTTAKKGAETGAKPAVRRRRKPTAT